ncbi:MAG: CbbX protein, partial [Pseudonocardiaceae bacterium]
MTSGTDDSPERRGFGMPTRTERTPEEAEQAAADANRLPDGAVVDLAEQRHETGIDEVLEALDRDLVGLA